MFSFTAINPDKIWSPTEPEMFTLWPALPLKDFILAKSCSDSLLESCDVSSSQYLSSIASEESYAAIITLNPKESP